MTLVVLPVRPNSLGCGSALCPPVAMVSERFSYVPILPCYEVGIVPAPRLFPYTREAAVARLSGV